MKKLFQRDKPKEQPLQPPPQQQQTQITTPIHQQFASQTRPRPSQDEEHWEILEHQQQLPPGASPPVPSPTRSPSPYSIVKAPPQTLRKKTTPPVVVGMLSALEPVNHVRNRSEERVTLVENGQKEKKGFWGRDKDRDKERERERAMEMEREREREREQHRERDRGRDREENELTRKIGFLTATASEDWTLVLDVCDHASANETNAKEAVRALRREFKYGEPAAQLAAARLWAIMLRNSSDTFISQSTSRKFLDTLEDLLTSSRTSPVVRERVMDVLAAAAYASGSKKDAGFRGLWRRVKPRDKPEEGLPFDTDDAMFNPPALGGGAPRVSAYDSLSIHSNNGVGGGGGVLIAPPVVTYQDATPTVPDTPPIPAPKQPRKRKTSDNPDAAGAKKSGSTRTTTRDRDHRDRDRDRDREREDPRIIPPDEDMRRLFTECKIGVGNAQLLSEALATATPEELRSPVIAEWHQKCMDSQELIFTQIPWASAGAERSRVAKDAEEREREYERERHRERKRKNSSNTMNSVVNGSLPDLAGGHVSTREEELLADLLAANEQLLEALGLYKDLQRVALEREAEERSRREVRMDPRQRQFITEDGTLHADAGGASGGGSSSQPRSRSPSPARAAMQHPLPHHPQLVGVQADLTFQTPPPSAAIAAAAAAHAHQQAHQVPQGLAQQQQGAGLAPPPAAPHGPRLPGAAAGLAALGLSRTPSPSPLPSPTPAQPDPGAELANGVAGMRVGGMGAREYAGSLRSGRGSLDDTAPTPAVYFDEDGGEGRPMQPSAKALGKRKVEVDPYDRGDAVDDELGLGLKDNLDDRPGAESDEEDGPEGQRHGLWGHLHLPAQTFVYDAAAERTQQRIREGHAHQIMVNGVH
ncbi:hypothetical protein B0H11DRAFT_2277986 [Mycena galericulata]|nr:hypothetical protein B0H11DRAFT_2277986 [Mycena galericulata]